MPRARGREPRVFPPEFRQPLVALVRAGRTREELSREFEPCSQALRNRVRQAERDRGRRTDGRTRAERDEIRGFPKESRRLKVERDILSSATAWFARKTGAIPTPSSGSSGS